MIIVGAKGHAKDIISDRFVFAKITKKFVFDDITPGLPDVLFDEFKLLRSMDEAVGITAEDEFILALGVPKNRYELYLKFKSKSFIPKNFIATNSLVSPLANLGNALNIMPFSSVYAEAHVGDGCLINSYASVHHEVNMGDFVTLSPGARILGRATIGSFVEIGANAVILPNVAVGNGAIIGAGAVVTKDIPDNVLVVGVPGKIVKQIR